MGRPKNEDTSEIEKDKTDKNILVASYIRGIKGLLWGAAASPLLLVSIYFFKASPYFSSKESLISLLSYVCCIFLVSVGTLLSGLPSIFAAFQVLPFINQIFVGAFTLKPENCIAIGLAVTSMYFAVMGYSESVLKVPCASGSIIGITFLVIIFLIRVTKNDRKIVEYINNMKVPDLACTFILSMESALAFSCVCALVPVLRMLTPFFAGITSMCFLIPMEKALYYYPATAVIPFFTVFLRIFGGILCLQLYTNSANIFVFLSIFSGVLSAIFPMILA
ncbi:hypothetical protein NEFER03_0375 [Nematocida sp. LUAm3]|nr:hypothetical protein NEFER03_0375 [Nematocida sp. LUAm3]KAI5176009.1 hypothetical protein NEFER02_1855 [Nematocida sp. LUAm2]KAI5179106.1 hypothetical protein NEFER01_1973 [Nematocida sp. LUAm1]